MMPGGNSLPQPLLAVMLMPLGRSGIGQPEVTPGTAPSQWTRLGAVGLWAPMIALSGHIGYGIGEPLPGAPTPGTLKQPAPWAL